MAFGYLYKLSEELVGEYNVYNKTKDWSNEELVNSKKLEIRTAITKLMTRNNEDAFVMFHDASSKKYIQFSGGQSSPIVMDLPFISLSSGEFLRARVVLSNYPLEIDESPAFKIDCGKKVDLAIELCLRVFQYVQNLEPDFSILITEN